MDQHRLRDYEHLLLRSTEVPEWFWDAVVKDLDLEFYTPYRQVLDLSGGVPWTAVVPGRAVQLRPQRPGQARPLAPAQPAGADLGGRGGGGPEVQLPRPPRGDQPAGQRAEGHGHPARATASGSSCRWCPKTVIASLACSKIGAIFMPIFSGFGAPAAASRLSDCDARLLITADGLLPAGQGRADEGDRRRGRRLSARASSGCSCAGEQGGRCPGHEGRDLWWHEVVEEQSRGVSRRSGPIPRTPTW